MAGLSAAPAGLALAASAGAGEALDPSAMPSKSEVWADVQYLNSLGPRYCGNAAHRRLIDFLERGLSATGAHVSDIPHTALQQWLPRRIELRLAGEALPVGAFCRWSATTGPTGITAPLRYCGRIEGPSRFDWRLDPDRRSRLAVPADVRGRIALVEVAAGVRPLARMFEGQVRAMIDKDRGAPFPAGQGPSASSQAMVPENLEDHLKAAGALGVIYAWSGLADADAQGQSRSGFPGLPSIWVTPGVGARLIRAASGEEAATLIVEADTAADVPTRTLVAKLPGQSPETIILWTHTDGPNALQENGGVAILNMIRYLAKAPRSARRRSLAVVMVEGHFAEQYLPTSAWMKEAPDLVRDAVAFVAIEHLGGAEWRSDPAANVYGPTGLHELAFAFCPSAPMQALARQAALGQSLGREAVIGTDKFAFTPAMTAWREARIPTFGYISTPNYLMADAPGGHIDKLDPDLYYEQVKMLLRLVRALDAAPRELLKEA